MGAALEPEVFVQRAVEYRGFEIQIDLLSTSTDMFDVWFRIEASIKPRGAAALGERVKIGGGRFSRRWAYLVAEIARQAAIDAVLGPTD
jgi:hypothetical protein